MKRLADRAWPPGVHAGRAEKWHEVAVFEAFFLRISTVVQSHG
jgi:hypothetical protein